MSRSIPDDVDTFFYSHHTIAIEWILAIVVLGFSAQSSEAWANFSDNHTYTNLGIASASITIVTVAVLYVRFLVAADS